MCYFVVVVGYCCLLRQMVMTLRTALYWLRSQGVVIISYRRFGTTYRSQLEGPNILSCTAFHSQKNCIQRTSWSSKMGPRACPETSVRKYHNYLFYNAEQGSPHLFRGGSLKSSTVKTLPVNSHTFLFLYNFY
jgi:hypothetical protein